MSKIEWCPRCEGKGFVMVGHGDLRGGEYCRKCGGTGRAPAAEVAPEARATTLSNLSAEGAQEACAASDKPTEPNPPNTTPSPSKVGSGEGEQL